MRATKSPTQSISIWAVPTWQEFQSQMQQLLCESDQLDTEQAPLRFSPIRKKGSVCGMMFHVEGPRLLRTSAVWAADEHRILLYNSTGQRVQEIRLSEAPDLQDILESGQ